MALGGGGTIYRGKKREKIALKRGKNVLYHNGIVREKIFFEGGGLGDFFRI